MLKEKKRGNLKTFLNPFSGGVSKMKPFRTTVVLLALLVLPLFATQALADFTSDTTNVCPYETKVSANTDNQVVIGFTIPRDGDTLMTLKVRSYIERSFATEFLKLWVESNGSAGWQSDETNLRVVNTAGLPFQTNDVITISSINHEITGTDTFYITLDAYTANVNALADSFHETGLEVVMDPGYIELKSGEVNSNHVHNEGWLDPGFSPFRLIFDTQAPQFDLHFCIEENTCSVSVYGVDMVDHEDSVRVCATNVDPDIEGDIHVLGKVALEGFVTTKKMFGVPDVKLTCPNDDPYGCGGGEKQGCDSCWSRGFRIPDVNDSQFRGVDADTGHWYVCAWAEDSAGNRDTICIGHDDLLYMIDTQDPIIDSVTWELTTDWNGDGKIGLGDCIMIIGWGLSNAWEPQFECDKMEVDWSWYSGIPNDWVELDDVQEHNRVFRKVFCLTTPVNIDSADCPVNFLVRAWDNACNWDTLRQEICGTIDLWPPDVSVLYEWDTDYDTSFACIGIGDKVLIRATVGGLDIVSVTAWMDSAGIDENMQHAMPLPDRGSGVYDTIWTVTEPPIKYGKDADNSTPPPTDNDYRVWVVACDDVGNCDTAASNVLNKTLDSRVPRPIGFNCPDTIPCALHARSLPGGIIELYWDQDCDENDAWYFYVWASFEGAPFESIGATNVGEQVDPNFFFWHSEPLAEGYWTFKIKTQDNCSNVGDFSCVVGAYADATPPHVCIAVPDSGLTFGSWFPVKAVADSESHDVESACLWYRLRPDIPDGLLDPGPWTECPVSPCMYRPGGGIVFTDSVHCLEGVDYIGWVEMIVVACDGAGNCQDTISAWDDACLVDDDVFRPGRFFFYWDTLAPGVQLVSVNGFPSPQSACGFDVDPTIMNEVVIDVDGATAADSFEVEVRGLSNLPPYRIFHQDNCTMPCTIWVSVDNWPEGTQNLYVYVKDYGNDETGNLQIELCVPPQPPDHCIYISWPQEWMRIPCTGTSGSKCVEITAELYDYYQCQDVGFTEVVFQWSPTGSDPWYMIEEVIGSGSWSTCWDNTGLVEHGDTVYLRVIAHDEFYMADTSYMVKVFVDCEQPNVTLRIEDLFYTCGDATPKVPCGPLTLKAIVGDTLIDLDWVKFFVKRHSDPDIWTYWNLIDYGEAAWSDNIWMYEWEDPCCVEVKRDGCMEPGDYWDIRIAAKDISDNVMFDYDEDRRFDDSTFNDAVAAGAGITVFVDDEAPEPSISLVCDQGQEPPICIVNPSSDLGGTDEAFVQAGHDIYVEISPQPSEDTCEVMKVHYFLKIFGEWVHVGTSFDPYHFPITFNPLADNLIRPAFLEDYGHWVGELKAELHDSLGNTEEDWIDLYILDATPSQAVIVQPLNDSYVSGDVTLSVRIINSAEVCEVCYEYSSDGETWYPVNGGYPNACVYHEEGPRGGGASVFCFELTWYTLNTVPDGEYYLRAVATDCDNNVDDDPPTIKVTVANELPTVVMEDPRICERTCPDDTVDTLGYVGGTVTLYATASSTVPIEYVKFWCKNVYDPRYFYTEIGRDSFPTNGKYSVEWNTDTLPDGRYFVKAEAHNVAGKWGQSLPPIMISVDNTAPFSQIISIDGNPNPDGMDISKGDVIDIELVAKDDTSPEGWTRCYNTGVYSIEVCIEKCGSGDEITKCFDVVPGGKPGGPPYDGTHTVQWNTSGLEFEGCYGCYYLYVKATDCLGNVETSDSVEVRVSDITAPITTIGGFDGNYIYGYSSEKVSTLLFEYADSGTANWIPIGWSDTVHIESYSDGPSGDACGYYLYKTSWNPASLKNGVYQIRVISHDECSNQNDTLAPVGYFTMSDGVLTPHHGGILHAMSFEKNWCVGGMHGIVRQTSEGGTPVVIGIYGSVFECVDMQSDRQNTTEYAGSFFASAIDHGGTAKFLSSVTVVPSSEPQTGEPAKVTYFWHNHFDVVQVKRDVGTHGIYSQGDCPIEVTIPAGAVGGTFEYDRYIWVAPTMMPWTPVSQPNIEPIGDYNGFATYVSFTDCYYCCGWWASQYGGDQGDKLKSGGDGSDDCCFNPGRYAKIKMCYDPGVETDEEHLAVMWWNCEKGEYTADGIIYPPGVEGFNTEDYYVEFATTCLKGPFVVVRRLERQCDGSIVVNMLDIDPYCNGYTWPWPRFTAKITDNVQGTEAIDQSSIIFKVGKTDDLTTIYNGADSGCDAWARGYGQYPLAGYDLVSGYFRAGWNDPNYYWTVYYTQSDPDWLCSECKFEKVYNNMKWFHCPPAPGLVAGDGYAASVTAQNSNIQTCTATMEFAVDATGPSVRFADSVGAYVGENPHFCIYFNDTEAGLDKGSIWIDIWGDETSSPDPNNHSHIGTLRPAQLNWINDTTVCVDGTFEYRWGYLHVYVYGGPDCLCQDCTYPQYYYYSCGVADCVGNRTDVFWQYYTVDADGPVIDTMKTPWLCDRPLTFGIADAMSGLAYVYVFEDSALAPDAIEQDPHNPYYWYYTPTSDQVSHVDIQAWDNLGNGSVYSFDLPSDCAGPTVTFEDGYVCKNPTLVFWVTDPAGVDWTTVNARVYGCNEECWFRAEDLGQYTDEATGKVTLAGCHLDCSDGNEVEIYVYSGTNYTGQGPCDLDGNCGVYRRCSFVVDAYAPVISYSALDERPIRITITDARSGVDWETLEFYEDGDLVEEVDLDTETGVITYDPESGGVEVEIRVTDIAGCNMASKTFRVSYTGDDVLTFEDPHNYPNPFDPGAGNSSTTIDPGVSKDCYLTVKIYDFAGEFVTTIVSNQYVSTSEKLYWDGTTEGGTAVANGTYLCYIKAKDSDGATKTAVIKITVLKEDK
jgi:hypothetical protein